MGKVVISITHHMRALCTYPSAGYSGPVGQVDARGDQYPAVIA